MRIYRFLQKIYWKIIYYNPETEQTEEKEEYTEKRYCASPVIFSEELKARFSEKQNANSAR